MEKAGTSVNVIVSEGGTVANVVPDKCVLLFDTRFWTPEEAERLDKGFTALAAADWGDGITVTLEKTDYTPPMPYTDATKELVGQIEEAAKAEGFSVAWVDAGGGSDGNHMAMTGIPVIDGVGPAGGGFHTDREFLRVDTIEERIRMVSRFFSLI